MSNATASADGLVEEGLQLYSQGKLDEALYKWRLALNYVPSHSRAREYIKYVEENRVALERSFERSHVAAPRTEGSGFHRRRSTSGQGQPTARSPSGAAARALDWTVVENQARAEQAARGAAAPPYRQHDDDDLTPRVDLSEDLLRTMADRAPSSPFASIEAEQQGLATPVTLEPIIDEEVDGEDSGFEGVGPTTADRLATPLPPRVAAPSRSQATYAPEPAFESANGYELEAHEVTPKSLVRRRSATLRGESRSEGAHGGPDFSQSHGALPNLEAAGHVHGATTAEHLRVKSPATEVPEDPIFVPPPLAEIGDPAAEPLDPSALVDETLPEGERIDGMLEGARQLFEQGTFEGSLWLCERILALDEHNGRARMLLGDNRRILLEQYRERLADMSRVPVVKVPLQEIRWHKLDHRAGFLLSRIDGMLSYGDILDISGMSEFEACRILAQLLDQNVIASCA